VRFCQRFCVGEPLHETVGDSAYVLAGILICQVLDDLRRHLLRPNLQRLPLNGGEVLEHGQRGPASVSASQVPASEDSSTKAKSVLWRVVG
jgi:hypothetical protein